MKRIVLLLAILYCSHLAGQDLEKLYDDLDQVYADAVVNGQVDYGAAAQYESTLRRIAKTMRGGSARTLQGDQEKYLLINAYNLWTILQVVEAMPLASVKGERDFFSRKHTVLGQQLSLNQMEAQLQKTGDARIHMALVCGAKSCPPLLGRAVRTDQDLEDNTQLALDQRQILQIDEAKQVARISNIFRWYKDDFGDPVAWISQQIDQDLSGYDINYLEYDWSLNDATAAPAADIASGSGLANTSRYFASRLYDRGQYEVNVFNNYYTQVDDLTRLSFHTTTITYLMGIHPRLNIGLDMRIRGVSQGVGDDRFAALRFANEGFKEGGGYTRSGISAVGPRIKYQPWSRLGNITVQHILFFPTMQDGGGNQQTGFIDWGSPVLWNDLFFDQELGDHSSIFLQAGLYFENINRAAFRVGDGYWQLSTPITLIYNYFLGDKHTFYGLVGSSPRWGYSVSNGGDDLQVIPDDFSQFGLGYKYFITDAIQAEVLYTRFYSVVPGRSANTYNLGVRYYHW